MTCPTRDLLVAVLDGEATSNVSAEVRRHLDTCAACSDAARRFQALKGRIAAAATVPEDPAFAREISRRLSSPGTLHAFNWRPALAMASALAVALTLALVLPSRHGAQEVFTPRGGAGGMSTGERDLGFLVYAHPGGPKNRPALLKEGDTLHAGDGLSFAIFNRSHAVQRLLLFAVDAHGDLHWFYPAFEDARTDPGPLPLPAMPEVLKLPEGVVMEGPSPGALKIVALFVAGDVHVHAVEAALGAEGLTSLKKAFPGSTLQTLSLTLAPAP